MKMGQIAAALLAVTSAGAPALAQDMQNGMMMKEGMMMMIMPDGRMSTMQPIDNKMMSDMMMNHGKPMTTTHIMMMRDGKVHMMEDKKMSDGKMMSEHMMMEK